MASPPVERWGDQDGEAPPSASKARPCDETLRLSSDWGRESPCIYLFTRPIFPEQFPALLPRTVFYSGHNPRQNCSKKIKSFLKNSITKNPQNKQTKSL